MRRAVRVALAGVVLLVSVPVLSFCKLLEWASRTDAKARP